MSQRLISLCFSTFLVSGLASGLACSPCLFDSGFAYAADAPLPTKRNPADTVVVDLTAGRSVPATESQPTETTQVRALDLIKGGTAEAQVQTPLEPVGSRVPRTKKIDLTVPGAEAAANTRTDADYYPSSSDTVLILADRDSDPYEEDNRDRFQSHVWLHHNFFDPIETLYIEIIPPIVRRSVHNFVLNIEGPKIFANDVLQVDPGRAGGTLGRFVINSTAGIGGLFDVATWAGIPYRDNDFGMTLANYGVGDGPYLLIPLVGPSNPRDLTGKVVDIFINPLHFVTMPGGIFTSLGEESLKQGDTRSYEVGHLDALVETEADPYAAERHEERVKRQAEIDEANNGVSADEP